MTGRRNALIFRKLCKITGSFWWTLPLTHRKFLFYPFWSFVYWRIYRLRNVCFLHHLIFNIFELEIDNDIDWGANVLKDDERIQSFDEHSLLLFFGCFNIPDVLRFSQASILGATLDFQIKITYLFLKHGQLFFFCHLLWRFDIVGSQTSTLWICMIRAVRRWSHFLICHLLQIFNYTRT